MSKETPYSKSMILFAIAMIVALLSFVAIGAIATGYIDLTPPENPCIMNSPLDVVSGEIRPPWSGVFNTTPQTYYLWYRGKWKLTEGACRTRRCVTEKEYERRIYGH
jgi:hypothetical protein